MVCDQLENRCNMETICYPLKIKMFTLKKCKMVSVFTEPDVNTQEVGRTRDKRRKPRREAEWFSAYQVFS